MKFTLSRNLRCDDRATMGKLESENEDFGLYTLELPWSDNEIGESCIPTGTYEVIWDWYYKHGYKCFGLMEVPGRTEILIHIGNYPIHTDGCILIGMGHDENVPAVWSSSTALDRMVGYLGEKEVGEHAFTLEIVGGQAS